MPEAKHYSTTELNKAYLYTNYARNQIEIENAKLGENKLPLFKVYRKPDKENVILPSVFLKRASYGDLGDSFQKTFIQVANEYFGIKGNEIFGQIEEKLKAKGLEPQGITLTNNLIVNASIESYDDFVEELKQFPETLNHEASRHDTEKIYNLLLFREIQIQEEENKKFAPERSWSKLKTAINIWLKGNSFTNPPLYAVIAYDLQKEELSVMRKVISKALKSYKPIRIQEEKEREEKSRQTLTFSIKDSYSFTDNYEEKKVEKCILSPFYIEKNYDGKQNEEAFIDFLEHSEEVDWWFKNQDYGREALAIEYKDNNGRLATFYPDFIVRTKDGRIGLFDPKKGRTAEDAKEKAESLRKYIEELNKEGEGLWGGIVIQNGGQWEINQNKVYKYDEKNLDEWDSLVFSS